jgi:mRNA interferase RelE/StbE
MIVHYSNDFEKSVKKIKNIIALTSLNRVIEVLKNAESLQNVSNVKAIQNYTDLYRIRIGNYRLLLSHKRGRIEILLLDFLKRDENTYKFN